MFSCIVGGYYASFQDHEGLMKAYVIKKTFEGKMSE